MTRLPLAALAVAVVAVLVPAIAFSKGASEATITGPGLENPITLPGEGQPGGEQLTQLAETAGFFAAVFGHRVPDPMLPERPAGDLGPRYEITYLMPGPNNELDRIRQDLYPYAEPGPVSYTAPGQPFFGTMQTHGGWYVASSALEDALLAAGLPESPRAGRDTDGFPWMLTGGIGALVAALVLGVLGAYAIRRRPGAAGTA